MMVAISVVAGLVAYVVFFGVRALLGERLVPWPEGLRAPMDVALSTGYWKARSRGHAVLEPVHVLRALLRDPIGRARVSGAGGDVQSLVRACDDLLTTEDTERAYRSGPDAAVPPRPSRATLALARAIAAAGPNARMGDVVRALLDRGGAVADLLVEHGTARRELVGADPPDPTQRPRVVLLNDDKTPFEFVVAQLELHAGLTTADAAALATAAHVRGRASVPMPDVETAEAVVSALRHDALAAGYALVVGLER